MTRSFDDLSLRPELLEGLRALGLTTPTPVQEAAIPLVLEGQDAIVQAKTGSGKTLAFALPVLSLLDPGPKPQALVVVPTRELAVQVTAAIASVAAESPLRAIAIYGGVGLGPQEAALKKGQDFIVGTPGRLKDLHARGSLDLSGVRILILDEADEMLDMGFRRDIEFILGRLPAREQTLIFSATMPAAMEAIAKQHMKRPAIVKLTAKTGESPSEISHHFMRVKEDERLDALVALIRHEAPERAIIFTRMKHETKRLAQKLERAAGIEAGFLNGNMSQNARNTMMARFREGEFSFLVATDVAARGIDIEGLTHVFHYAVPTVVETYIHRSGRTGRAGNTGKTIILVTPDAEGDFKAIQKRVACAEVKIDVPRLPRTEEPPDTRERRVPDGRRQQGEPRRSERRVPQAPAPQAAAPSRTPREAGRSRSSRTAANLPERDSARLLAQSQPDRRPTTGPLAPLPRHEASWRRFRLSLAPGHTQNRHSLHGWLAERTGVPRSAMRSISVHADHATIEVEARESDRFLAGIKGAAIR